MGKADDGAVDTVVDVMQQAEIDELLHECAMALRDIVPDPLSTLTRCVVRGRVDKDRAVEVLAEIGEPVAPRLLLALAEGATAQEIATATLPLLGWRVVERLRAAGRADLATLALHLGPLRKRQFIDEYIVELRPADSLTNSGLPTVLAETADYEGRGLRLLHAAPDRQDKGWLLTECVVDHDCRAPERPVSIRFRTGKLPHSVAVIVAEQVQTIGRMIARPRNRQEGNADGGAETGILIPKVPGAETDILTTKFLHARVLAGFGDPLTVVGDFSGSIFKSGLPDWIRPLAAAEVLSQALASVEWKPEGHEVNDLGWLKERCARPEAEQWRWIADYLRAIAAEVALRERPRK